MEGRGAAQSGAANDLFDYDLELDDIVRERHDQKNSTEQQASVARQNTADDANLGLDEEIKVTKARRPVPKLDEDKYDFR
ncbi:chromosome segregation in meiosis- protein, partial [Ascosphaera aggregata]